MPLRLLLILALCGLLVQPAQAEPGNSLAVKEMLPPLGIERFLAKVAARTTSDTVFTFSAIGSNAIANEYSNSNGSTMDSLSAQTEAGKRFVKKVIAGSLSSAIFSYVLVDVLESGANLGGLGSLEGALYGHLFGFPIGVSSVDPYDSFFGTLMGGILGEVGVAGFLRLFAATGKEVTGELRAFALLGGPAVGSLIASEAWRKPPQDRRVSLALAPTLNGGLSATATLRF